jgi:TetR/AcrR family transcriptional regulator, transcriptional repressor for nem operon
MRRDGPATRERILGSAYDLVLRHGFAATSLDAILAASGVTKGAFFHHFRSKDDLAAALFDRFLAADLEAFEGSVGRAERLTNDPLQQVLVAIGLLEESFATYDEPAPGCLVAAFAYQEELLTAEVRERAAASLRVWRDAIEARLRAAERLHPPVVPLDHVALADMLNVVLEGGYIMGKVMADPGLMARYLRFLRTSIELLFGVAGDDGAWARPTRRAEAVESA